MIVYALTAKNRVGKCTLLGGRKPVIYVKKEDAEEAAKHYVGGEVKVVELLLKKIK